MSLEPLEPLEPLETLESNIFQLQADRGWCDLQSGLESRLGLNLGLNYWHWPGKTSGETPVLLLHGLADHGLLPSCSKFTYPVKP
jgi:hypothetical protein